MDSQLDILDRQTFVNEIQNILLLLSERKRGCAFAVDGTWGVGKTYILEMLENQIELPQNEDINDNRFFVFHYNCWQYDYYEEPAIAIVSAMLEKVNSQTEGKVKKEINGNLIDARKLLLEITGEIVKNKIGINLVDVYSEIHENNANKNKDTYKFDSLFTFKKTLDDIREKIKQLAKEKTVVLVVDELDRCMPSYAIKVLERLHHLFEGLNNVVILMAIDSKQLEHSIKEIYGEDVDTERYLKKFINFKVKLAVGIMQGTIFEKYREYFDHFIGWENIQETLFELFSLCKLDARNLDKIFEKINLMHELVCKEKVSASVLVFEIFWGIFNFKSYVSKIKIMSGNIYYKGLYWIPEIDQRDYSGLEEVIGKELIEFLKKTKSTIIFGQIFDGTSSRRKVIENEIGVGFWLLDQILGHEKKLYVNDKNKYNLLLEICEKFYDLGKVIY